jgi:hypothetical protein
LELREQAEEDDKLVKEARVRRPADRVAISKVS